MDVTVTLRFFGAELVCYMDSLTGEVSCLINKEMRRFPSTMALIAYWRDTN